MVPAYNAARTILATLDSVAAQTYRPIELIIINDGSTDATDELARHWIAAHADAGIAITYRTQGNQGLLRCRQLGFDLSAGAYLQFLDADDLMHPEKLSRCVQVLSRGEHDVAVARTEKFQDGANMLPRLASRPDLRPWTPRELLTSTITSGWWHSVGPLFTRHVVCAVGGFPPEVHPVAEELEFHGRIKLATKRICYLDEVLNFYRTSNETSITSPLPRLYEGRIAGAAVAVNLLQRHRVRSFREWMSVLRMSIQTYYQAVNCYPEPEMLGRAWAGIQETAHAWKPLAGLAFRFVPRGLVNLICRWTFSARKRRAAEAPARSPGATRCPHPINE
jgi:glycosyltransferase involved in cell wall biosynthesis